MLLFFSLFFFFALFSSLSLACSQLKQMANVFTCNTNIHCVYSMIILLNNNKKSYTRLDLLMLMMMMMMCARRGWRQLPPLIKIASHKSERQL